MLSQQRPDCLGDRPCELRKRFVGNDCADHPVALLGDCRECTRDELEPVIARVLAQSSWNCDLIFCGAWLGEQESSRRVTRAT